ncbi:MAG: hypothetical protein AAF430_12365 [Myxococcota bacterium]
MKRRSNGSGLALLSLLGLACAAPPPAAPAPVLLEVEVLRGLSVEELTPTQSDAPVVVLFDSTRSMARRTGAGASHSVAARRSVQRFLGQLDPGPVWLYAMGSGAGPADACQRVYRGARAANAAERDALMSEINGLSARGEASLTASLDGLRADLTAANQASGARVVVFGDLGDECGGDVCAAAQALVAAGARVDFVALGSTAEPACLSEPKGLVDLAPPPPAKTNVHVRVEAQEPEPRVVGCSEAGGLPIQVPPGKNAVVVDLDPPLRLEANFSPGKRYVLQVLDFPSMDPPTRDWRWLNQPPVSEPPP